MKVFKFILPIMFLALTTMGATKSLQGDNWKSPDLSKTWTPAGTQGQLVTSQSVSGDMTAAASGDYSRYTISAGAVQLSSDVSGALPIANGGTGQIVKAAAFDALSPMSASGDITYGGNLGTGTRLPPGTLSQLLTSNESSAPSWSYSILGAIQSKTTTYNPTLISDGFIKCNATSGAFTVTILSAATAGAGKIQGFQKTDSSFNAVTISGTGMTTNKLMTIGETVFYISDGSNWIQLFRQTDTPWISYTPTYVNFGTVTTNFAEWKRVSNGIIIRARFSPGTTVATACSISLPSSWTTARMSSSTSLVGAFTNTTAAFNATVMALIAVTGSNTMSVGIESGGLLVASTGTAVAASGNNLSFSTDLIPITDFEP